MGWRDGAKSISKIEAFLLERKFSDLAEDIDTLKLIHSIYMQGYEDGWETSKDYDPKWDAD